MVWLMHTVCSPNRDYTGTHQDGGRRGRAEQQRAGHVNGNELGLQILTIVIETISLPRLFLFVICFPIGFIHDSSQGP